MKNVAGYDVSRLMAGSLGTLGVILEASLKVLPLPPAEATLHMKRTEAEALNSINQWAAKGLPLSATAYCNGDIGVRLSGASAAVEAAIRTLGGTRVEPEQAARFWRVIREQTDPYFADSGHYGACRSNRPQPLSIFRATSSSNGAVRCAGEDRRRRIGGA
jgi:glycolate oxidase FAD binding subunit